MTWGPPCRDDGVWKEPPTIYGNSDAPYTHTHNIYESEFVPAANVARFLKFYDCVHHVNISNLLSTSVWPV